MAYNDDLIPSLPETADEALCSLSFLLQRLQLAIDHADGVLELLKTDLETNCDGSSVAE